MMGTGPPYITAVSSKREEQLNTFNENESSPYIDGLLLEVVKSRGTTLLCKLF